MKKASARFGGLLVLMIVGVVIAGAHRARAPSDSSQEVAKEAVDPNAPPPVSSALPFRAPCENDAQCASGTCYAFMERGKLCSQPCAVKGDCPAGSTCNRKHFCK